MDPVRASARRTGGNGMTAPGNLLTHASSYTSDYELSQCQVKDGATVVLGRSYARDHLEVPLRGTDNLNLTGITDQVTAANSALPRLARLPPALARPRLRLPQPEMPLPD